MLIRVHAMLVCRKVTTIDRFALIESRKNSSGPHYLGALKGRDND